MFEAKTLIVVSEKSYLIFSNQLEINLCFKTGKVTVFQGKFPLLQCELFNVYAALCAAAQESLGEKLFHVNNNNI